jgi:hypothetical protein
MATSYTTLLGLALPVQGELSGSWGNVVNDNITNYLDSAIAGALTVTTDTTLTKTTNANLGATSSQYAIIIASPASANITITAPAASKIYTIINTSATYTVKIVGAGPTTGITLGVSEKAQVAWNGSDFVRIGASGGPGVFSSITNTGLTSGRVVYSTTGGLETDSANLLFNGTTLTANTLNLTNALGTTYGGTGLTSFTANGVVYASSSSALTTGSALTFDGIDLAIGNAGGLALFKRASDGLSVGRVGSRSSTDISVYNAGGVTSEFVAGANELRFNVAAAEQMRLTSTGLGIGTSSPSQKLTVANGQITVTNSGAVNPAINFAGSGSGASGFQIGQNYNSQTLFVYDNAASSQRLTLDSSGNLNIGTTGQTDKLYVYANTSSSGLFVRNDGAGPIQTWATFGTTQMLLNASGNLGLGVTPNAWSGYTVFQVKDAALASSGSAEANLTANSFYGSLGWTYKQTAASTRYALDSQHRWFTAPSGTAGTAITFTQAMTLDASGNLGIGTTSPGYKLDVRVAPSSGGAAGAGVTTGSYEATLLVTGSAYSNYGVGANSAWLYTATNDLALGPYGGSGVVKIVAGGSERMRLDSSGNLGLGVTPSAWYNIVSALQIKDTSIYSTTNTANFSTNEFVNSSGQNIYKNTGFATIYAQNNGSHQWYNAPSGTAGNAITFTQAMTLDASGNLLVGTTSSLLGTSHSFKATGSTSSYYAAAFRQDGTTTDGRLLAWQLPNTNNSTAYFVYATNSGGNCFNIFANGNVTNTNNSYGAISDVKLKENIVDASPKLAALMQVKVRNYNLIGHTTKQLGVVAQELETVFPAMVDETPDRDEEGNNLGTTTKSVKYSVFVPMLIKAIQEQQAIIQSLTDRVTQLETKP